MIWVRHSTWTRCIFFHLIAIILCRMHCYCLSVVCLRKYLVLLSNIYNLISVEVLMFYSYIFQKIGQNNNEQMLVLPEALLFEKKKRFLCDVYFGQLTKQLIVFKSSYCLRNSPKLLRLPYYSGNKILRITLEPKELGQTYPPCFSVLIIICKRKRAQISQWSSGLESFSVIR